MPVFGRWCSAGNVRRNSTFPHAAHSKIRMRPGSLTCGISIARRIGRWHLPHCGEQLVGGLAHVIGSDFELLTVQRALSPSGES
jgi:hypothetical protein